MMSCMGGAVVVVVVIIMQRMSHDMLAGKASYFLSLREDESESVNTVERHSTQFQGSFAH